MKGTQHVKNLCLIMALALVAGCSGGSDEEYFEGVVSLRVDVEAHGQQIPPRALHWFFGRYMTWFVKDGDYVIRFSESNQKAVWYRADENREYQLRSCDDHVTWTSADAPISDITSVTKLDETREIAGYTAHGLEVRSRADDGTISVTRYWYVPELKVNPEWFSANRTLGWDQVYQHIDSLIVGSEEESDLVSVRRFATRIEAREVADRLLELPDMDIRRASLDTLLGTPPCPMPQ